MRIERFEDIEAWQLARELTRKVQSELYVAMDEDYIAEDEFQKTDDLAGRTRAAIWGFMNYLRQYAQSIKSK